MVRCSVASFISVHAIAVNWSASSSSVSGASGSGSSGLDPQGGQLFGGAITDVLPDDDRRCVIGDLHPLRAGEIGGFVCREHEREFA